MGAYQRRKGHDFEREIAREMRDMFPDANRVLEYQQGKGFDVEAGPLFIQCKRGQTYAPVARIEQARDGIGDGEGYPALITKADRKKTVICMYLEDFMRLGWHL